MQFVYLASLLTSYLRCWGRKVIVLGEVRHPNYGKPTVSKPVALLYTVVHIVSMIPLIYSLYLSLFTQPVLHWPQHRVPSVPSLGRYLALCDHHRHGGVWGERSGSVLHTFHRGDLCVPHRSHLCLRSIQQALQGQFVDQCFFKEVTPPKRRGYTLTKLLCVVTIPCSPQLRSTHTPRYVW